MKEYFIYRFFSFSKRIYFKRKSKPYFLRQKLKEAFLKTFLTQNLTKLNKDQSK